ncbi:hypothetical protein RJ640_026724 [Escallonia rubra]|uniref:SAM domain-containing protein n=1 Tax=Escallonia rubra TaxID=112253 RepID=A0AA88R7A3_9ASTE|nr:hypothetical protein RJ640_026724 [Escallonia rubra]
MAEPHSLDNQLNGGGPPPPPPVTASAENVGAAAKRQRRPSVRLGDIGHQPLDSQFNRRLKPWKHPLKDSTTTKSSKTRPLTNLNAGGGGGGNGGGGGGDYHETLDGEDKDNNLDSVAIGSWRVKDSVSKSKRGPTTKRIRSNWASNADVDDDGFRGFEYEGSESPLKDPSPSPIQSLDRGEGREEQQDWGADLDGPSDTDARNWNNGPERDGVRVWLNQLGLGRYAPVFEVHEVDDEVLPMLTLEDLKDMGINAVGSRRKMYCSIQKLGKGFS